MDLTIKTINKMKNFQLKKDSAWVEVLNNEVTEEQKAILVSDISQDGKTALLEELYAKKEVLVEEDKAAELDLFYDTIKPSLKESEVYELIALDLVETNEKTYFGILNCRVNAEHIQIRF
jgi:hypothetical protein